ncbi:MAG: hypothetical protein Kow00114_02340 [Kiloniellaceae bacterium]
MTFVESLDEPLLAELYAYWSRCRGDRFAPARADIDPVDIPHLLPHVALSEIVSEDDGHGRRFRYRLAGTRIEERFGCALTNRYLDELKQGPYLEYIVGLYERIIAEKVPIYSEGSFSDGEENTLWAKRLMLPLSEDGATVTMVLAGILYLDSDPAHRTTVLRVQDRFQPSGPDAR